MEIDEKDKLILYELSLNSRSTTRELSRKIKISKSMVNYRINNMKSSGLIQGSKIYFNYSKLGFEEYVLYIKWTSLSPSREKEITKFFKNFKQVSWLGSSYGNWETIIEFRVENINQLYSILEVLYKKFGDSIKNKELVRNVFEEFYGYKFQEKKDSRSFKIDFIGERKNLDSLDMKIVHYLMENQEYKLYELSEDLGIGLDSLRRRLKKLELEGIIVANSIKINLSLLGLGWNILQISSKYTDDKDFLSFLKKHPNIFYVYKYLGKWDYEIGIYLNNGLDLEKIITEIKQAFPDFIKDYEFSIIKKLHKTI